jgi:hypothetical protein
MWYKSGIKHTIKYWAEVMHLVLLYLDSSTIKVADYSVWVKKHKNHKTKCSKSGKSFYNLPVKLPFVTKVFLVQVREMILRGSLPRNHLITLKLLLSALSFFRCCSFMGSKPKITTITGLPTGKITLPIDDIRLGLKKLKLNRLKVMKPSIRKHFSLKGGPNFPIAVFGIGMDTIAWIKSGKWLIFIKFLLNQRYYFLLVLFVLSSFFLYPFSFLKISSSFVLGVISTIDEARGKVRLIGITDWWTQVAFKPLHDSIYKFLDSLATDGTRDQGGPIDYLIDGSPNSLKNCKDVVVSVDLSAATDRLPVQLQADILCELGYDGESWKIILDRLWSFDGGFVKYAVGQPMGAYSSFAMLALTQHVLVNISSVKCNEPDVLYAILGDDTAIKSRVVSKYYVKLLNLLGVEVNPIKGFNGKLLEFAKQLHFLNGINISPLGAKNIMLFIRKVEFLPSILMELITKSFPLLLKKKARKSIYLRAKRRVRGLSIPIISYWNLYELISKLFFSNSSKVNQGFSLDNSHIISRINIHLHLLSYIGPHSGLWSLKYDTVKKYYGHTYNYFENIWKEGIYVLCTIYGKPLGTPVFVSRNIYKLEPESSTSIYSRILLIYQKSSNPSYFRFIKKSWYEFLKLFWETVCFPLYLDMSKIKNIDIKEYNEFHLSVIFLSTLVFSPSMLIMFLSISYDLLKNVLLINVWLPYILLRFIVIFKNINQYFLYVMITFLSYFYNLPLLLVIILIYLYVNSKSINSKISLMVYNSKYGFEGKNLILNILGYGFDPFSPKNLDLYQKFKDPKVLPIKVPSWTKTLRAFSIFPEVRDFIRYSKDLGKKR